MNRNGLRGRIMLVAMTLAVSLGLAGCSWTIPGLKGETVSQKVLEDDITTGSIKPVETQAPLAELKNFTDEDWRRAKAALAVAVDPHGSSDRVLWDNPKTLAKGSFAPEGAPFVRNDQVCRNFKTVVTDPAASRDLVGTACRPSGGDWEITDLRAPGKANHMENKEKASTDLMNARKLLAVSTAPKKLAKASQ